MENKKALDVFQTRTTGWSFSSSLCQPTSSLFSSLLLLLRMKTLTVCPVLSKLTPKAPYHTAFLFRNALNHPAFVVGFLLLVWFCLTEICELTNAFSCCINEGWMLPGYGEQKTGMFSDELGSLAWAHSVSSNHCCNHPSSSLADWLTATWGYVAMSLMSRAEYPGWLELYFPCINPFDVCHESIACSCQIIYALWV